MSRPNSTGFRMHWTGQTAWIWSSTSRPAAVIRTGMTVALASSTRRQVEVDQQDGRDAVPLHGSQGFLRRGERAADETVRRHQCEHGPPRNRLVLHNEDFAAGTHAGNLSGS